MWALASGHKTDRREGPARLLRIDPRLNRAVARIPIHKPSGGGFNPVSVQIADGAVWVIGTAGALQVDPATGSPLRHVPAAHAELGVVAEGDTLWLLGLNGRLRQVDARTGRTVETVRDLAPGSRDSLWLYAISTPERRDRLVRLDAGSGHQTGQVEVPNPGTVGLVRVGRELWIGHPDGRITVVS